MTIECYPCYLARTGVKALSLFLCLHPHTRGNNGNNALILPWGLPVSLQ